MTKVIKAGAGAEPHRTIVEAEEFDQRLLAERLLAEAQAEAERTLRTAKEEAERLRAQAIHEGRERGLAAVSELLVGARMASARAQKHAEADLRTLAVRIAEKILGRELALRPEGVIDIALEALRLAGAPREIVVRCNPEDLEALERGKPRLLERARGARAVTFRADPAIPRGGCTVETELGVVDARLATQLEAIERALRGELGA